MLGAKDTIYNEQTTAAVSARQVEEKCHAKGLYPQAKLKLDGIEAFEGGLRIWVKQPDGLRLRLDFGYQGLHEPVDFFELRSVSRWQWISNSRAWNTGDWVQRDLDPVVATALKDYGNYQTMHDWPHD
jgi:hypothetical protein